MALTLTAAQRYLIETPGSLFVDACPGAGKTEAVVQRYVERPGASSSRRGVALLSFTRAAADEAKSRCIGRPDLMECPNFAGTIDGFINRFIVGPVFVDQTGIVPTFKDRWDGVHGTSFKLNGQPPLSRVDFQLDWFSFEVGGTARFHPENLPYWAKSVADSTGALRCAEQVASVRWQKLISAGIIDCAHARALAVRYFADPAIAPKLKTLLCNRFFEVIVDEVQDSNTHDLRLFHFLLDAGLCLVLVGDVDQAIYEFRGSSADATAALAQRLPASLRMADNWRSSPAICKLVDSLRSGEEADKPCGKWRDISTPIYLPPPRRNFEEHVETIDRILANEGLSASDIVCLAHTRRVARACAGAIVDRTETTNRLVRLAQASLVVADESERVGRQRIEALRLVQYILRDISYDQATKEAPDVVFYDKIGLIERQFRDGSLRLALRGAANITTPSSFKESIKQGVSAMGWDSWVDASKLRIPNGDKWPDSFRSVQRFKWATVHGYKGLQALAVALAISKPPRSSGEPSGVELWRDGGRGDSRRTLYVGASRAERLLVLLTDASYHQMVQDILVRDGVPFTTDVP
ncbi:MAG: UvrD-helicase domain-containing protein [Pseudonocardiaceae bacterium]